MVTFSDVVLELKDLPGEVHEQQMSHLMTYRSLKHLIVQIKTWTPLTSLQNDWQLTMNFQSFGQATKKLWEPNAPQM